MGFGTNISTDIKYIKGVGDVRAKLFNKLGVNTVGDLLFNFPRDYQDWSQIYSVLDAPADKPCCIKGTITKTAVCAKLPGGRLLIKSAFSDGENTMPLTFFNNRFIADKLVADREFFFYGRVSINLYGEREMLSPEISDAANTTPGLHAIYRQTEKLNSRAISQTVARALDSLDGKIEETLPKKIIEKYRLPSLYRALKYIHFPATQAEADSARRRFIFEELLILQLGLMFTRRDKKLIGAVKITDDYSEKYYSLLPFTLTGAQKRAVNEATTDMLSGTPMNRLLQGDVGSGKTAVAGALIFTAAYNTAQSLLLAPTQVLATQHYNTFIKLFANTDITVGLLTGAMSQKEKNEVKRKAKAGEIDLLIGTHAAIQKDVKFYNLALVITDEQHRFGVKQRGEAAGKAAGVHVLVMSATPIPRTLGLLIFGDLDISVLDELPPGRQPVNTYCVTPPYRDRANAFIKKQLDAGHQGYIICPLIEDTGSDLMPAEEYAAFLADNVFKSYRVGLLHGRMKAADKDRIMLGFSTGEIQLLVSTTVIEVGVDVPNANIMIIENAERFGLSQLHQLRGRIGRGGGESYCILISGATNPDTMKRLEILSLSTDGFRIAEEDLRLRGAGDFFGERQHGLPTLKIADLMTDTKALFAAEKTARNILADDPPLVTSENKCLRDSIARLFENTVTN